MAKELICKLSILRFCVKELCVKVINVDEILLDCSNENENVLLVSISVYMMEVSVAVIIM